MDRVGLKGRGIIGTLGTVVLLSGLWSGAQAMPITSITLDSSTQCSAGNATNGIAVGDVTGDLGGASDCWGTFDGNDPGKPGGEFIIDGMTYSFFAKQDTPGGLSGVDIGLSVSPSGGAESGTWSFDDALFNPEAFLIVLKAASKPGYGVWLFEGADAASFSGDWFVAWGKDLSHLSVFGKGGDTPTPPAGLPVGSPLALLGFGLVGLGLFNRRRQKS